MSLIVAVIEGLIWGCIFFGIIALVGSILNSYGDKKRDKYLKLVRNINSKQFKKAYKELMVLKNTTNDAEKIKTASQRFSNNLGLERRVESFLEEFTQEENSYSHKFKMPDWLVGLEISVIDDIIILFSGESKLAITRDMRNIIKIADYQNKVLLESDYTLKSFIPGDWFIKFYIFLADLEDKKDQFEAEKVEKNRKQNIEELRDKFDIK